MTAHCEPCQDGEHENCEATLTDKQYDDGVCCCNLDGRLDSQWCFDEAERDRKAAVRIQPGWVRQARSLHEHCDWPRCACWCRRGAGTRTHPPEGHHCWWSRDGGGDGYPTYTREGSDG